MLVLKKCRELVGLVLLVIFSSHGLWAQAAVTEPMTAPTQITIMTTDEDHVPENGEPSSALKVETDNFHIRVVSDWQLTPSEAAAQAQQRLRDSVFSIIQVAVRSETRCDVQQLCDPVWPTLLLDPTVIHQEHPESTVRQYGRMWRQIIDVKIPRRRVAIWAAEHANHIQSMNRRRQAHILGSVLGELALLVLARRWDRHTLGYRRPLIFAALTVGTSIFAALIALM